jgi:hypothetical protein
MSTIKIALRICWLFFTGLGKMLGTTVNTNFQYFNSLFQVLYSAVGETAVIVGRYPVKNVK